MTRWRKYRWWLVTLAVIAAGVGVWWWLQPREMRLVSATLLNSYLHPCDSFSCYHDQLVIDDWSHQVIFCTWDGTIIRRFTLPQIKSHTYTIPQPPINKTHPYYRLSPDGHWMLVSERCDTQVFFTLLHDGEELGTTSFTRLPKSGNRLEVNNNGEVWAQIEIMGSTRFLYYKQLRLLAQGEWQHPGTEIKSYDSNFAPYQGALVVRSSQGFTYFSITVQHGVIQLKSRFTGQELLNYGPNMPKYDLPQVMSDGRLECGDGVIYNKDGHIDINHKSPSIDKWTIPQLDEHSIMKQSENDQYMLVDKVTGKGRDHLRELFGNLPLAQWEPIYSFLNETPDNLTLLVYEQPGKCVASIKLPYVDCEPTYYSKNDHLRFIIGCGNLTLAPADRELFAIGGVVNDNHPDVYLLKFTW